MDQIKFKDFAKVEFKIGEIKKAMIFGGEDESGKNMSLLLLDKDLLNGSKVF